MAIGVKPPGGNSSGADDTAWQDRRVAFGLTNLLAESFYETGEFRLVEEKDLRQRQVIEESIDLFWSAFHPASSQPELVGIGRRLEADLLAYGRVDYTKISSQRIQVGPVGRYQQTLRINIEVCLYEISTQQTLCRPGAGRPGSDGVLTGLAVCISCLAEQGSGAAALQHPLRSRFRARLRPSVRHPDSGRP